MRNAKADTHHKQRALSLCLLRRLGQPAFVQPDKEPFTVCERRETEDTQLDELWGKGGRERSENKVSRMSSATERRGQRGETPSKYQVRRCLREGWVGGSARQNRDVSIASDDKSDERPDEIFKTSRLPDNLCDPDRTASARNVGVSWRTQGVKDTRLWLAVNDAGDEVMATFFGTQLAAIPLFNSKTTYLAK